MKIEHKFMEEGQLVAVMNDEKNGGSDHPGREDSNKESPNKEDLNRKDPGKVRRNFSRFLLRHGSRHGCLKGV